MDELDIALISRRARGDRLETDPANTKFRDMADIQDFHAHIYYDPGEVERAKLLASEVQRRFGVRVGHFHLAAVGPHPRGSCQMTVPVERFGEVAVWLSVNRDGLTIFAHASTGDDRKDHSANVIWFGPSEGLNLAIFG